MEFTFYYPTKWRAKDGLKFIVHEVEMKVDIEIDPRDSEEWYVTGLYAACLEGPHDWLEMAEGTEHYVAALEFLRTDKETLRNLASEIDDWLVENRPSRGLRVHEHSTYLGRP